LLIAFGRQNCRSVKWTATHINKRNFFKAPTSNVEDKGTILAQDCCCRGGNRNSMPHLDDSFPGTSFLRIKEFIYNE
jgi:hypothetical protein